VLDAFDDAERGKISAHPASVLDAPALREAFRGADGVFHLAGVVEHSRSAAVTGDMSSVTVRGTVNAVSAAAAEGIRRVVYASTSGVAAVSRADTRARPPGDGDGYADEVIAAWPYYACKAEAERAAIAAATKRGVDLVCMRPSLLLGPGDRRLSSCRLVADLLRRRVPLCPTGGLSFVDVRDCAGAFLSAMNQPADAPSGRTYLVGGHNVSLRELLALVEAQSGVPAPRLSVPRVVERASAQLLYQAKGRLLGKWDKSLDAVYVEMGQAFWYLDASAAERDLGFRPRPADVTVGDTVAWLQANWDIVDDGALS